MFRGEREVTEARTGGDRAPAPRVLTIPSGAPFLATLADALLTGEILPQFPGQDPLALSQATIFLPTRRAARALATILAERFQPAPVLLPRIVPLGDFDEAEMALAAEEGDIGSFSGALPPALAPTERHLLLTELVLAWARAVDRAMLRLDEGEPLLVPASPADAFALAGDLARLMDTLAVEDIAWSQLAGLVEERYSQYFKITLDFLRIAAEQWPAILQERGASDPVRRRNALVLAEAERLRRERPPAPIIAAGSTGSVPATAKLLAAIAQLPAGAVVLPGLDQDLDADSWATIGDSGHPQAALKRLLETIGATRDVVRPLGTPPETVKARSRFLSEALRPAETSELWASPEHRPAEADVIAALDGLAIVEAPDERQEALAAALALRETLEEGNRTAALVTPDRGLAERVAAELRRWDIVVEDSAGLALARSRPGSLARLVAEAAAADFAARPLLALLAHPLATFGLARNEAERAGAALEIGLLRGPAPPAGLAGLAEILPQRRLEARSRRSARPFRRLTDEDWARIEDLLARLRLAFRTFSRTSLGDGPLDLVALATHHVEAFRRVSAPAPGSQCPAEDGEEELARLFDDLAQADVSGVTGRLADYPTFFDALAGERVVRRSGRAHRRVKIWGLLEARLMSADRLVLGGLDEGVWPPAARTDAFLNRPMRTALGLSPPERRIGQTAHDFAAALGTRDVVVTRALKRGGAPTVPSRFLQRMRALAGDTAWGGAARAGARYLAWAEALTAPRPVPPLRRPAPRPQVKLLPRALSVTEIETLMRDPYAIFARHVLKLDPLDDLATAPGATDRGSIVHRALGDFATAHPRELPGDPLAALLAWGREAFAPLTAYPDVAALWWPRFLRLARAYVGWEEERRPALARVHAEISGQLDVGLPDGCNFSLRARADRIEERPEGLTIVDFKTGQPPSPRQVFAGFAPQLTLEAAMVKRGAFEGVPAREAVELLYMHASGGVDPLAPKPVKPPSGEARTVALLIEEHLARLQELMARYFSGEIGFASRPFAEYAKREGPYDHLARVAEWSLTGGAGEGGET